MKRLIPLLALALGACASAPAAKPTTMATGTAEAPLAASADKKVEACDMPGHANAQPKAADATGAKKAFDAKPQAGEKALCAVTGEAFTVTAETKVAEYKGKYYVFCCDGCEPDFKADPAKFAGN